MAYGAILGQAPLASNIPYICEYKSSTASVSDFSIKSSKNFSYALVNILPNTKGSYGSGSYLVEASSSLKCSVELNNYVCGYQISATNQIITITNINQQYTMVKVIFFY